MTTPNKTTEDASAIAFFSFAREYHEAANCLYSKYATLPDPVRFLYFQKVELALKAFLRSHDLPILGTWRGGKEGHKLTRLYDECRKLGLRIGPDDKFQIGNIVSNLEAANVDQGLRYFSPKPGVMAQISWIREVVEDLMRAVDLHLKAQPASTLGPAIMKVTLVWGKPTPKKEM